MARVSPSSSASRPTTRIVRRPPGTAVGGAGLPDGPAGRGDRDVRAGRDTALVTGATAGIGAAFAEQLAEAGHDLVLVARDAARLEAAAARLRAEHGVAVEVLAADLSDREQARRVAERAGSRERPVDVLVNNAGFGVPEDFPRTDPDDEERLLDVLVRAPLLVTRAAAVAMVERGRGAVVTVSSVAGFLPLGTYSAAKAWATTFSESLAANLAGTGVTATAVCPGYVRTEFHRRAGIAVSRQPWPLWSSPTTVARAGLRGAARGAPVVVPGLLYSGAVRLVRATPRGLWRAFAARRDASRR